MTVSGLSVKVQPAFYICSKNDNYLFQTVAGNGAVCGNPMTRKTTQDNDIPCFRAAYLRTITRRFMKFLG